MVADYYSGFVPYYKLIYPDWDASLHRQAADLDSVIREYIGEQAKTVLDAACGIGTQSIGLAKLGYTVTASDLSPAAVDQAQREATRHQVQIEYIVADMRQVWQVFQRQFDILIACDNSVPHLLTDGDILQAFEQFYQCLRVGGGCLISVRDYARMDCPRNGRQIYPRLVHQTESGQIVLLDVWHFVGAYYDLTTYIIQDEGQSEARTQVLRGGRYYCVEITQLENLFRAAGFRDVIVLRERYFQPLLVALK